MTNKELENKIIDRTVEAFALMRQQNSKSNELVLTIRKNSNSTFYINCYNDAYKNEDVTPLMVHKFIEEKDLNFKVADVKTSDIFDREEALESYDRAAKEVIKAAEEVGDEKQIKFVKVMVNTMRAAFNCQIYLDGRAQE